MATAARSPILWQNHDQTVTLLDIPRSIEAAQGTEKYPCSDHLLSCEALQVAFPSDQPKSDAAKAKLTNNTVDQKLHAEYDTTLKQALEDIERHYGGPWCYERPCVARGTKRKRTSSEAGVDCGQTKADHGTDLPQIVLEKVVQGSGCVAVKTVKSGDDPTLSDCTCDNDVGQDNFLTNCAEQPATCQVRHQDQNYIFRLPPRSSALLGDCSQPREFHRAVRAQASAHETPRHFDFILMDPPWPNRSVRRTHKTAGATYQTSPTMNTMYDLIAGMDLDMLMSDDCLVSIWTTNKQAVRDLILGEGGLFEQWGVELEEEWLWLKVTAKGEPVMPFDNVWRKPYEVLLIGRRHRPSNDVPEPTQVGLKRRVLVGVPDLHSRKPCLKQLLESLLPDSPRVLEIFARHLMAGWWSWGNECIKFNWDGYWRKAHHHG